MGHSVIIKDNQAGTFNLLVVLNLDCHLVIVKVQHLLHIAEPDFSQQLSIPAGAFHSSVGLHISGSLHLTATRLHRANSHMTLCS